MKSPAWEVGPTLTVLGVPPSEEAGAGLQAEAEGELGHGGRPVPHRLSEVVDTPRPLWSLFWTSVHRG